MSPTSTAPGNLYSLMLESVSYLKEAGVNNVDMGVILGSGLKAVQEILDVKVELPYAEIPHMVVSGAPGHEGILRYGRIGLTDVLMFCGRLHYYEGYPMWQVTYPVRIFQAFGVKRALLTAAAGGLSEHLRVGDLALVNDHISLMPDNPLRGITDSRLGERFPDLTNAYDPVFAEEVLEVAGQLKLDLKSAVYAGLQGPSLETQAECNFLRSAGADVVGMSMVPEVVVGVQAGIAMAAICIVSNLAWHPGVLAPSKESEILEAAGQAASKLALLLKGCCSKS